VSQLGNFGVADIWLAAPPSCLGLSQFETKGASAADLANVFLQISKETLENWMSRNCYKILKIQEFRDFIM
jgi:hypothetical protein